VTINQKFKLNSAFISRANCPLDDSLVTSRSWMKLLYFDDFVAAVVSFI
jgi:hypothetical protein